MRSSLFSVSPLLVLSACGGAHAEDAAQEAAPVPSLSTQVQVQEQRIDEMDAEMVEIINVLRAKKGLPPLVAAPAPPEVPAPAPEVPAPPPPVVAAPK